MDLIDLLPLHDALVDYLRLDWSAAILEIDLLMFSQKGKEASPYTLQFNGVSYFEAPRRCPWGESVSINSVERTDCGCKIEMQSGDVFIVEATSYELKRKNYKRSHWDKFSAALQTCPCCGRYGQS